MAYNNSFFTSASNLNISGGEYNNVNGSQTKNVNHNTNITGSYNTKNTTSTNSGNSVYDSRNQSSDTHQVLQDHRRIDDSARNNPTSQGHATRTTPWAQGHASQQPQQPYQPTPQRAYPQHRSIEDQPAKPLPVPRSAPLLTYNDNDGYDEWEGPDKALNDQIMASLNLNPNPTKVSPPLPRESGAMSAPLPQPSGAVRQRPPPMMSLPKTNDASRPLPPIEKPNPFRQVMAKRGQGTGSNANRGRDINSRKEESKGSSPSPLPSTPSPKLSLDGPESQSASQSNDKYSPNGETGSSNGQNHRRDETKDLPPLPMPVPGKHHRFQSHSQPHPSRPERQPAPQSWSDSQSSSETESSVSSVDSSSDAHREETKVNDVLSAPAPTPTRQNPLQSQAHPPQLRRPEPQQAPENRNYGQDSGTISSSRDHRDEMKVDVLPAPPPAGHHQLQSHSQAHSIHLDRPEAQPPPQSHSHSQRSEAGSFSSDNDRLRDRNTETKEDVLPVPEPTGHHPQGFHSQPHAIHLSRPSSRNEDGHDNHGRKHDEVPEPQSNSDSSFEKAKDEKKKSKRERLREFFSIRKKEKEKKEKSGKEKKRTWR